MNDICAWAGIAGGIISASSVVYLLLHAWKENAQEAATRLRRAQERKGTHCHTETGWGIGHYDAKESRWYDSMVFTVDEGEIDEILARWRADSPDAGYRKVRRIILLEVIADNPAFDSGK